MNERGKMFPGAMNVPAGIPILNRPKPPNPAAAQARPVPQDVMAAVIAFFLKDRAEAGEMKTAVMALVSERHRHFHVHNEKGDTDWRKCDNPICRQYDALLSKVSEPEETISILELQASASKRVLFKVVPNAIRVYMEDKPLIVIP